VRAALAARCAGCGTELPPAAKFCLECGAKVVASLAAPPPPEIATPEHLADKIRRSRANLEGERKQVTRSVGSRTSLVARTR
jgi:hypothetical protein